MKDIGGEIAKMDDKYIVRDNNTLQNLVLSSTQLRPNKSTSGHKHKGQEEIYFFVSGNGTMELDDEIIEVSPGDVILIEDDVFHRVHSGNDGCYFVCVFDGRRSK